MEELRNEEIWRSVYEEQKIKNRYQRKKNKAYKDILESGRYIEIANLLLEKKYLFSLPQKFKLNKLYSSTKKTIFIFDYQDDFLLKVVNKIITQKFAHLISPACHSFQKNKGAKTAYKRILNDRNLRKKYVLKTDIHNFFNSIDIPDFFEKLPQELKNENVLFYVLNQILNSDKCIYDNEIIEEKKGLMAGTAIAPFLSNLYLKNFDDYFIERKITYARYSDDLIFFDTKDNIFGYLELIKEKFEQMNLKINKEKTKIFEPDEKWTFLGFSYNKGKIDIAKAPVEKLKMKVRRMSRKYFKYYSSGKFAKEQTIQYFVKRLNKKFYGSETQENTLCWARWFFPIINTSETLGEIDKFVQDKLRYSICGKYSKKNFKTVPYTFLKKHGYLPIKTSFFLFKNDFEAFEQKTGLKL